MTENGRDGFAVEPAYRTTDWDGLHADARCGSHQEIHESIRFGARLVTVVHEIHQTM